MPGAQVFYGACTYLHPYVDDDDDDRGLRSARDGRLDGSSAAGGGGQHRRRRDRERSRSALKAFKQAWLGLAWLGLAYAVYGRWPGFWNRTSRVLHGA